ncbi:GCP1 [Symbiodinium pilosum]|uniref:GCP1 protein n=1 Tax=Symbiodinium pilosum TaxID=2952 RepID=A0A812WBW5_SYMPI|nr:GCP1 [Symbiodinium pilosum]
MGSGFVKALQSVVPSIAAGSSWAQRDIGPTLRRFFGAYFNGDVWAVYRRYKNIDVDNSGWISYEELGEILFLPEFNLLFIFDAFSQQNALIDGRELLVMVCLFSSAKLSEKCGVFMTLFDSSHSGTCTAAEVANFATLSLQVLGRCTGACVRLKDIAAVMQEELSDVLPQYREAANRLGVEATFKEERIFGQDEIDEICSTFRHLYEELPIGQQPPANCVAPPAPDWQRAAMAGAASEMSPTKRPLNRTLTEGELTHMAMLGGSEEDGGRMQAAEALKEKSRARQQELQEKEMAKAAIKPAKGWMIVHGADFVIVSKELARFRHLFVKCVAQALEVPSGILTVIDITPGSVVVEFLVHPSARAGDNRNATQLLIALADQLINSTSTLRRGHFGAYAASAELLVGETRRTAVHPLSITDGIICCDQSVQCCSPQAILDEVLARLEVEQRRAEAAEEKYKQAVIELRRRDESVKSLTKLLDLAKQQEEEKQEEERDSEIKEFDKQLQHLEELAKLRALDIKEELRDREVMEFKQEIHALEEQRPAAAR